MAQYMPCFEIRYLCFLGYVLFLSTNVCFSEYCGNRLRLIYIPSQKHNGCISVNRTFTLCNNLNEAVIESSFNNSCLYVDYAGNISLNVNFTLKNVHGFTLRGKAIDLTVITCNISEHAESNGILVTESSDIFFSSFSLLLCGLHRHAKAFKLDKVSTILSSAIYYEDVENIFVENVAVLKSSGYGITIIDPKITCFFNHVTVSNSIAKSIGKFSFSGGVYLDISNKDFVSITFNKTKFQFNSIGDKNICNTPIESQFINWTPENHRGFFGFNSTNFINNPTFRKKDFCNGIYIHNQGYYLHAPISKGGGMSIFLRNNASNKIISFFDHLVNKNEACFGGGLYLYFSKYSCKNQIFFNGGAVLSNKARILGGGISVINQAKMKSNHVSFVNVSFSHNSACIGGGIGLDFVSKMTVNFSSLRFDSNQANTGSSLQTNNAFILFKDVYITNNSKLLEFGSGAIHASNSDLSFFGNNTIAKNSITAVYLDSSILKIYDILSFKDNSGYQGGAAALFGESFLSIDKNASLNFESNTATKQGGAIFVHVSGVSQRPQLESFKIYNCFFQIAENFNGNVTFLENKAGAGVGNDIFTSTLETCRNANVEKLDDVISKWSNFVFNNHSHSISTNAVNISIFKEDWNAQPGSLIDARIILIDERGQNVDEEVSIFFQNSEFYVDLRQIVQNSNASFRMYGPCLITTKLFIQSASSLLSFDIQLDDCSFGYHFDTQKKSCVCGNKSDINCFDAVVYIPNNTWAHKQNLFSCPKGYCKKCTKNNSYVGNMCKLDAKNQCAENRNQSSILCSACKDGFSVVFGSSDCKNCTGEPSKVAIISSTIFALIAFFNFILLLLNTESLSWYLIASIYSYQVLDQVLPIKVIVISVFFIELFNSVGMYGDYGFAYCFYNHMNDLEKKALMYIVAVWWLFSLILIQMIGSRFLPRIFSKESFQRSLAVNSFVVYSITAKVSLEVLSSVSIDNETKILIFAERQYFTGYLHKMLVVTAIVLIIFFFGYPFLILCSSINWNNFTMKKYCSRPCFGIKQLATKEYFKCYQDGLKKNNDGQNQSHFPIFYFLARIFVLIVGHFSPNEIQQTCVSVACLMVLVFFLILKPFVKTYHNIFHAFQLTSLFLVALWSDTFRWMYLNESGQKMYENFINVLAFMPIIMSFIEVTAALLKLTGYFEKFRMSFLMQSDKEEILIPNRILSSSDCSHCDEQ